MSYRFVCTNCGKKFELETPDAKECPFCYWSSSVKREDLLGAEKKSLNARSSQRNLKPGQRVGAERFLKTASLLFRIFLAGAILAGVGILGYRLFRDKGLMNFKPAKSFSISFSSKSQSASKVSPKTETLVFSPQEKEILYHEAVILAEPDSEEQKLLNRTASFQTGDRENLPSGAWTLPQYQKMIEDQERFYKMSFARSYKNKLTDLFKNKYQAASEAFTKGDILVARNFWVESLVFPLYSQDLKKHRAVALTMLRPFINDTLAKIRTMNQILSEQAQQVEERALAAVYQNVLALIEQKKWQEALTAVDALMPRVITLQQSARQPVTLPPYPPAFGMIDQDIQPALLDLMSVNPLTLADLQPLQQDLVEKKEILLQFTQAYREKVTATYRNALELIHQQKWQEALAQLESIQGPRAIQEDAARKIAILQKKVAMMTTSLPKKGE